MEKTLDLTRGSPMRLMVRFAMPMLIGNIFQTLYSMVDAAVLGRFVGADALASIGAASSTVNLMTMIVTGFTGAVSVAVSQAAGSHEEHAVARKVAASLYICLAVSVVLGIVSAVGAGPLMRLLQTPEEALDGATAYVALLCGFCITSVAYNLSASVLRAIGDSRTPLLYLILCSLLNIALDLLAVLWLHGGVVGVAVATLVSQAISSALCFFTMFRHYPILRLQRADFRPNWKEVRSITGMGLQMAFQSALLSVGMLVITRVINGFGSGIVAAYTVGSNVQSLVTIALYGFVLSFSIYVGQNYGAEQFARIRKGFWEMAILTAAFCVLATAISLVCPRLLASIYLDSDEQTIRDAAVAFIKIQSYFYLFLGAIELYNATVRGFGRIAVCTVSSVIELVLKVGCSAAFAKLFGYTGIWYAAPVGWIFGIIPSAIYYHRGSWSRRGVKKPEQGAAADLG